MRITSGRTGEAGDVAFPTIDAASSPNARPKNPWRVGDALAVARSVCGNGLVRHESHFKTKHVDAD